MSKAIPKTLVWVSLFCLFLISTACAPTLYQQPVANFQDATKTAKEVYFKEIEKGCSSFTARQEVKLKLDIFSSKNYDYSGENYLLQRKKIVKFTSIESLPQVSLKVRQRAFEALGYYSGTLRILASDETTEALKTELTGFNKDLGKLIKSLEGLKEVSEAFDFLAPLSSWIAPLESAVNILNGIIDIISDYLREQALKKAIIKADPMVQELLELLKQEAIRANEFQENNFRESHRECANTVEQGDFAGTAETYLANDLCLNLSLILSKLPPRHEIGEVFKLVQKSHTEMKSLAEGGDFNTMIERIRHFNQRIQYLKTQFDIITNR